MLQSKVPSEVVSKRQQYINSIKRFIQEQNSNLQAALVSSGVDLQLPHVLETLELKHRQVCPYNKDHVVPEKTFKKHTEQCKLLKAGCQRDEVEAQLVNYDFAYRDVESAKKVEIDEKSLNKIIWDSCIENGQVYTGQRQLPHSHIEENIYLGAEDRLALYRHVIKTRKPGTEQSGSDQQDELLTTDWASLVKKGLLGEQNNKGYGSLLEHLAALRDMKRRRQSYRAKNVHINNKSYTEIIREVIVNQMQILTSDDSDANRFGNDASTERHRDRDKPQGSSSRHNVPSTSRHKDHHTSDASSRDYHQSVKSDRKHRLETEKIKTEPSTEQDGSPSWERRDDEGSSEYRKSRERRDDEGSSECRKSRERRDDEGSSECRKSRERRDDEGSSECRKSRERRDDEGSSEYRKSRGSRKRSRSLSSSTSGGSRERHRKSSKKSKHKKKHSSKKHKKK